MSDSPRWHLGGLPGTTGIVEVMLYDDHLAAVAAAEQRVKSDFAKYLRHMVDDDKFASGVKAAREAVAAAMTKRGGYHSASEFSAVVLAAIDALLGES